MATKNLGEVEADFEQADASPRSARADIVKRFRTNWQGGFSVSKAAIKTAQAPAAIGPYAQAVRAGNLLFVSGQIPLDPATGQMVDRRYNGPNGTRAEESCRHPGSRGFRPFARAEDDGLSPGSGGLRQDERGLRQVSGGGSSGPRHRSGGPVASGRRGGNRPDCRGLSRAWGCTPAGEASLRLPAQARVYRRCRPRARIGGAIPLALRCLSDSTVCLDTCQVAV